MATIGLGVTLLSLVLFAYPFLAPTQPVAGEILVVEGWLPDYALEKVKDRFANGQYKLVVTTGGLLTTGHHLSQYKTWARLAASTLNAKGVPLEKIMSVPSMFIPKRDRTYNSVLEVKKNLMKGVWLRHRLMWCRWESTPVGPGSCLSPFSHQCRWALLLFNPGTTILPAGGYQARE